MSTCIQGCMCICAIQKSNSLVFKKIPNNWLSISAPGQLNWLYPKDTGSGDYNLYIGATNRFVKESPLCRIAVSCSAGGIAKVWETSRSSQGITDWRERHRFIRTKSKSPKRHLLMSLTPLPLACHQMQWYENNKNKRVIINIDICRKRLPPPFPKNYVTPPKLVISWKPCVHIKVRNVHFMGLRILCLEIQKVP